MNRRPLIAGNWKLNKNIPESIEAISRLQLLINDNPERDILIAPAFTSIYECAKIVNRDNFFIGGQNLFWEESGAFTGEVSASMLRSAGCQYVLVGHSERRHYFNETGQIVNKKIKAALQGGLMPVLCIGETENENEQGLTDAVIHSQISLGLKDIPKTAVPGLIVAYEPVWAIGTGKTATPELVQQVHETIREALGSMLSEECAQSTRILYGGSVNPENINALMALSDVDGVLVGGASLDPETFARIVNY